MGGKTFNIYADSDLKGNLRKNAPQKDNPKQLFFGFIFFPVHSLEIFLQILYQQKFLDFLTPILTYFEVKKIPLLEGTFCTFVIRKYEIRNTKAKNMENVCSILILGSHYL